jgi:hypothetical protein
VTSVISGIAATLVTLPIISYLIFFIITKQSTGNHRRSVQLAMDLSTILFIFSVHYLIVTIWNKPVLWLLLLIMISIACTVVVVHYKVKGEIVFKKVFKGFWRLNFAFFFLAYLLLATYGIISRIYTAFVI